MTDSNTFDFRELREKYGEKLYTINVSIEVDDFSTDAKSYIFKKPSALSFERMTKGLSNSIVKSSRTFVLDNIIDEQSNQLIDDLEEYPALAQTLMDKLCSMLGLAKDTSVKKLSGSASMS